MVNLHYGMQMVASCSVKYADTNCGPWASHRPALCLPSPLQVTLQLPNDLVKKQESKRQQELEAKPPKWLSFDCDGSSLGIHRPGIGLWLCRVTKAGEKMEVTDALMLGDGRMSDKFTWVGFSSTVPGLLAVGTDGGRVMLFSPKSNKLTAQKEGKHPGKHVALVAGDC